MHPSIHDNKLSTDNPGDDDDHVDEVDFTINLMVWTYFPLEINTATRQWHMIYGLTKGRGVD